MQLSLPLISSRFVPNIFLSTPFMNTLSLSSFPNVEDHVSHPYKTSGEIKLLCILIFMFLDGEREGKRFWTEWWLAFSEFLMPLISSYIQFCFITVGPRYFDFDTFSNNVLNINYFVVLPSILFTRCEHVCTALSFLLLQPICPSLPTFLLA